MQRGKVRVALLFVLLVADLWTPAAPAQVVSKNCIESVASSLGDSSSNVLLNSSALLLDDDESHHHQIAFSVELPSQCSVHCALLGRMTFAKPQTFSVSA